MSLKLQPADILLYKPTADPAGFVIAWRTWHLVGHVEMYLGNGQSYTARIPNGVRIYPWMPQRLKMVLRPVTPLDMAGVREFIRQRGNLPYGWGDLFEFIGWGGWTWNPPGEHCGDTVTQAVRAGGLDPFNGESSRLIAPFQFALSNCFQKYEIEKDTEVLP
jgi:hypothetical protein